MELREFILMLEKIVLVVSFLIVMLFFLEMIFSVVGNWLLLKVVLDFVVGVVNILEVWVVICVKYGFCVC